MLVDTVDDIDFVSINEHTNDRSISC